MALNIVKYIFIVATLLCIVSVASAKQELHCSIKVATDIGGRCVCTITSQELPWLTCNHVVPIFQYQGDCIDIKSIPCHLYENCYRINFGGNNSDISFSIIPLIFGMMMVLIIMVVCT